VTKIEAKRKRYKGLTMIVVLVLGAAIVVQVLLQTMVEQAITKEQYVKHSTCPSWGNMGDGFTNSRGDIIAVTEAKRKLPLFVAPILPEEERESLQTLTISYRDPAAHDVMVEEGLIGANDTSVVYPTVKETLSVVSFKSWNATAADIGVAPGHPGEHRFIRILNGEATLIMRRADGTTHRAALCAGKVSCAAFSVEVGIADAFEAQATGNLSAIGVAVPAGRRLADDTASVHRRLSEDGECPCSDGWVKVDGEWVQPTDEQLVAAGYVKDADGAWVQAEGSRRLFPCEDATDAEAAALAAELSLSYGSCAELRAAGECDRDVVKQKCAASCDACGAAAPPRELYGCEDAADEVVAATSEEALGTRIEGCAELVAVMGDGACGHELLQTQCPATCGMCDDFEAQDRLMHGRQMVAKCGGEGR
jgi:hypothetical protein